MKTSLGLLLGACLFTGCVSVERVGSGDSTLTVEWTIDDSTDPLACDDTGTASALVAVESRSGRVNEFEVDCDRFGIDIDLPAGHYWVTVVLLDAAGHEITSALETEARDLVRNSSDYVSVDFPYDSFF